jgi:hypothetical protein
MNSGSGIAATASRGFRLLALSGRPLFSVAVISLIAVSMISLV